ncbi:MULTISPECIES: thermostable hemolysin [unclassified Phaeobacter]|uniref:thermostable hemolysin n=1 Tax=unclassified Phaeobacter TaxID=2621772 RepID=UPI003A866554
MRIDFLSEACAGRIAAENHIKDVYWNTYRAKIAEFAPLLVVAQRLDGEILCAAGIRTARDGFFSDAYLHSDFSTALHGIARIDVPPEQIMEVVSLASTTPFPVLPMLDRMIEWGRENGMTCGVFTATSPLRRLLRRTGLRYTELASAQASQVANPQDWGSYYQTDPRVCAFSEVLARPVILSPRARAAQIAAEAS